MEDPPVTESRTESSLALLRVTDGNMNDLWKQEGFTAFYVSLRTQIISTMLN